MNTQRPVKKEQLYDMDTFTHFCRTDEHNTRKLGNHIIASFLDAAEKDELILPLYSEERIIKNEKGEDETKIIKFYSPFQIFLASVFSENVIDKDGNLRNPSLDWEVTPGNRPRYLTWDQGSFNVEMYKERKHQPMPENERDYFGLIDNFHNFLKILHSLDDERHSVERGREMTRYYKSLPSLQYNLEPFKDATLLAEYGLDVEKLKKLLYIIAYHATRIDPLEHWYYYTRKHPQWRRDELKGMASVAQDLYGLCDILTDVIEMNTGEKLPPLFDFLHPDFKPFHMKKTEYAGGEDLLTIKDAFLELKSWMEDPSNQEILNEAKGVIDFDKVNKALATAEVRLTDFEQRYGDRRYPDGSGMRYIHPETSVKLSGLDPRAKNYVDITMKQRREHGLVRNSEDDEEDILRTNNPEVISLWQQGKTDEAAEKYFTIQEKYEISRAIEHSLGEIRRDIADVCSNVANSLYTAHHRVESQKTSAEPGVIKDFMEKQDKSDPRAQGLHVQFWNTGLKEALKVYDDKLKQISAAQDQMHEFISKSRLVYCAECRKHPVVLHQHYMDGRTSGEAICDDCLSKSPTPHKIKSAPWNCDYCGKKIYQFAHGNILSDVLVNTVPATVRLDYGRMEIEVKCQNKKCGEKQWKTVDWGWLP